MNREVAHRAFIKSFLAYRKTLAAEEDIPEKIPPEEYLGDEDMSPSDKACGDFMEKAFEYAFIVAELSP